MKRKRMETAEELRKIEEIKPRKRKNTETIKKQRRNIRKNEIKEEIINKMIEYALKILEEKGMKRRIMERILEEKKKENLETEGHLKGKCKNQGETFGN